LGRDLRKLLLSPEPGKEAHGFSAVGLFLADMVDLFQREILPTLGKERTVILLDRFWYSTWCYQAPDGASKRLLLELFREALPITPDLKILLHLPLEESLRRCKQRGAIDYIEARPREYHQQVFNNYQELALIENFHIVPAETVEGTHQTVIGLYEQFLRHSHKPSTTPPQAA
jgi:thymidylate kinase